MGSHAPSKQWQLHLDGMFAGTEGEKNNMQIKKYR